MNKLKHFTPEEILLTEDDAKKVYQFFFPESQQIIDEIKNGKKFDHLHMQFAQALLVEGLDRSYEMGYVDILVSSLFNKKKSLNSAKTIFKKFAKKSFSHWFEHATEDELWEDAEIYEAIRFGIMKEWSDVAGTIILYDDGLGYL